MGDASMGAFRKNPFRYAPWIYLGFCSYQKHSGLPRSEKSKNQPFWEKNMKIQPFLIEKPWISWWISSFSSLPSAPPKNCYIDLITDWSTWEWGVLFCYVALARTKYISKHLTLTSNDWIVNETGCPITPLLDQRIMF